MTPPTDLVGLRILVLAPSFKARAKELQSLNVLLHVAVEICMDHRNID